MVHQSHQDILARTVLAKNPNDSLDLTAGTEAGWLAQNPVLFRESGVFASPKFSKDRPC